MSFPPLSLTLSLTAAQPQYKPPAPQPAAPPPAPAPSGPRYFALYDYAAADDDEISFNEGTTTVLVGCVGHAIMLSLRHLSHKCSGC
jgi:hypothetical protein